LVCGLLLGALSGGAAKAQNAQSETVVRFGVYSFKKPTDVYQEFRPAVAALQETLIAESRRPIRINLQVFKTYEECLEAFVAGEIDFVRFGPASYVLAKQRNPKIELLAVEQEDGKKRCMGVIAVRRDSEIKTLADLRGKRFAFGDSQSTIGRYLSQAELVKAGVLAKDLAGQAPEYLERHDIVFKAVESRDFDAGAMHIHTFEELNKQNKPLRVLQEFENVGKPWIARAGLEPQLLRLLRQSLLQLREPAALKALKIHGLLPAADKDFELVRNGMRLSEQFEGQLATPAPGKRP
jgi:phosphonate transport system substrate-binding protein